MFWSRRDAARTGHPVRAVYGVVALDEISLDAFCHVSGTAEVR